MTQQTDGADSGFFAYIDTILNTIIAKRLGFSDRKFSPLADYRIPLKSYSNKVDRDRKEMFYKKYITKTL